MLPRLQLTLSYRYHDLLLLARSEIHVGLNYLYVSLLMLTTSILLPLVRGHRTCISLVLDKNTSS